VIELDPANSRIVLSHGPIPQVGWDAMTMGFPVEDPALLDGLAAGDNVRFDIRFFVGPNGPTYVIVDLEKI
jgi:Cu/Ag efflux protein CusF